MTNLSRLRYDLVALLLSVGLLVFGAARGGGFHIMFIPLILVLAAVYVSIERSRDNGRARRDPLENGPKRLLWFLALAAALVLYSELSYDGEEAAERIVTFSGILIAASLTSLYLAARGRDEPSAESRSQPV